MGEIAALATALASTHDLNVMFVDEKNKTWRRIKNLRAETVGGVRPFEKILAPSDPANKPPRVQSLRFAANELTRHVNWKELGDPSRGNRRALLRWLSWVEMDATRRVEAQKMVVALDYFAKAQTTAQVPTVTFTWSEQLPDDPSNPLGKFSVVVDPAITTTTPSGIMAITIAVSSTDVHHSDIRSADEDD